MEKGEYSRRVITGLQSLSVNVIFFKESFWNHTLPGSLLDKYVFIYGSVRKSCERHFLKFFIYLLF